MRRFRPNITAPVGLLLGLWALATLVLFFKTVPVSGDGIYYFAYLRSLIVDHDLDFKNELQHFTDNPHVARQLDQLARADSHGLTATGKTPNLFSIGPALLWAPLYVPVHVVTRGDGFSLAERFAPSIATALYGLAGLLLSFSFLRSVFPKRDWPVALAVAATFLGSNLVYYLTFESSMAHVLGFFVVSLLLWLWWRWRAELGTHYRAALWRALVLGLVAGLAGLVRWQLLAVAMVIPLGDLFVHVLQTLRRRSFTRARVHAASMIATAVGVLIGFFPQMLAWRSLYGHWLLVPQGNGFIDLSAPHLWEVLISARHGLFTWTPLIALATIGILAGLFTRRVNVRVAITMFLILALQVYINGTALEWWGGEAFGARRFTDVSPVFMFGLAVIFVWASRRAARAWLVGVLTTMLVIANLLFMQAYRSDLFSRADPVNLPTATHAIGRVLRLY